jgi:hypothetical protein
VDPLEVEEGKLSENLEVGRIWQVQGKVRSGQVR